MISKAMIKFRSKFQFQIILWLAPHMMTLKFPPNLYALPGPINMTTMIRQHTKFPPTASSPRKT